MATILLIATRRQGKLNEFKRALKTFNLRLLALKDINFPLIEPEETSQTFKANALLKARFYANKSRLLTLADDSGLIVDALPNKLGVKTKRYALGSDKDRWQKLLKDLKNVSREKRTARFVTNLVLFNPQEQSYKFSQGICQGEIAFKPKGKNGFGFDPVFMVKDLGKHFAQLTLAEKNLVSHRAKALLKMKKYLKEYET